MLFKKRRRRNPRKSSFKIVKEVYPEGQNLRGIFLEVDLIFVKKNGTHRDGQR